MPDQWRSQKNSKGGARQQEKTLAFTNNFSASYPPPGIFYSRGVPGHLGHPPPWLRPCARRALSK